MKFPSFSKSIFQVSFFLFSFVFVTVQAEEDKIQFKVNDGKLTVDLGGRFNTEAYTSGNVQFLNSAIGADSLFYARTTFDIWSTLTKGDYDTPELEFYNTLRFRFKWGSNADAKNADGGVTISRTRITIKGTSSTKHLAWMRESWLKIALGDAVKHENYLQMGLIPFAVGRGISLGAAYEAGGFLGFNPGSSIEQYAPAVLLSFTPIEDRFLTDFYFALTQNNQTSFLENLERIYTNQIDNSCSSRGIGQQAYIAALRSKISTFRREKEVVVFEPYIVYQKAPGQDLEFTNDVNSYLNTVGLSIEGSGKRFSWGVEAARNFGSLDILAWDRNYATITGDPFNANVVEIFTKVYIEDPTLALDPVPAPNTLEIIEVIAASPKTIAENGKAIGVVDDPYNPGNPATVYNAYNRFRPAQVRKLEGWFFVADAIYEFLPKELNVALGVGYASGFVDQQLDTNLMTTDQLMNEEFGAFIPLQSVYNGKRLRHLIIFNQGVPRFNTRLPNADLSLRNTTGVSQSDTVNEMTNIAFIGTRADWRVQKWKKNQVNLAQNVIAYWAPEVPHVAIPFGSERAQADGIPHSIDSIRTRQVDHFMGVEFTTEYSMLFYDKLKLSGYLGFLVPGGYYKDLCGTLFSSFQLPTGADIGYVGNLSIVYFF